jgi:hypothetical protein
MADGKEQLARSQKVVDLVAATARPDRGAHVVRVDRHCVETRNVEQHASVAHMIARPAVAARPNPDHPVVGVGEPDRGDHILFDGRLHDDVGVAFRQIDIAATGAAGGFIVRVAMPKYLANEIRRLLHGYVAPSSCRA